MPNTSESAYQHLRPAFQSWDKNVGSIDQTPSVPPHPNTKKESGDETILHIIRVHDFWVSQNLFWKSWQLC